MLDADDVGGGARPGEVLAADGQPARGGFAQLHALRHACRACALAPRGTCVSSPLVRLSCRPLDFQAVIQRQSCRPPARNQSTRRVKYITGADLHRKEPALPPKPRPATTLSATALSLTELSTTERTRHRRLREQGSADRRDLEAVL